MVSLAVRSASASLDSGSSLALPSPARRTAASMVALGVRSAFASLDCGSSLAAISPPVPEVGLQGALDGTLQPNIREVSAFSRSSLDDGSAASRGCPRG
jgi:hypothetical protein